MKGESRRKREFTECLDVSGAQQDVYRGPVIESFWWLLDIKYHFLNVDQDSCHSSHGEMESSLLHLNLSRPGDSLSSAPWQDSL